ncbi:arylsulfatase [Seonamhaeicola algicola]|nr:arylsulfatase [Seonamhaeicola algicola]
MSACSKNYELKKQEKPNVILILTDDQGYGDLSCHGNPYFKTPNMDKLHEESVRFTDFHVDPTCAPTRAALLTGKYAHNVGVWHTIAGGNHLKTNELTMANVFKESGYATGLFGKWHLGANYPYRPIDRGFDEWLGQGDGGTGTTDDWFDNDRVNDYYWHNGEKKKIEGYAPDVFYNAAINFIKQKKESKQPFFVYLPTYLPHHPHTVPDVSMANNFGPEVPKNVSYFYAGIQRIDRNIGKLRKTLENLQLADNTILIFMSDNGGTEGVKMYNAGMKGRKGQAYEGGHRVPFFIHWKNGAIKHGKDVEDLTSHFDVLPTLIDLCGLKTKTHDTINFDGRSFKQQLYNPEKKLEERILFVENQRTFKAQPWVNMAAMTNRWRLIDNTELYDMETDFAQTTNVINKYPDVVKNLRVAHKNYWEKVTPNDREVPRPIIGSEKDTEVFLTPSDWYLPAVPWNHSQVAKGFSEVGEWHITVETNATYTFEVSRWPREAKAPIAGVPSFKNKTVDAWLPQGGVKKLIYGNTMVALPVQAIALQVGDYNQTKPVKITDTSVVFEVPLKAGNTSVKGQMLNSENNVIAGTYYIYITKK